MRKTFTIVMIALTVVASACADGGSTADRDVAPKAASETSATTVPEPTPTVAPSTTTPTPAPSTTAPTPAPSTTVVTSEELNEAQALLASIKSDADITSARIEGAFEVFGLSEQEAGLSEFEMVFSSAFNSTTGDSSFLMDMSSMAAAVEPDPDDPFAELGAAMFGVTEVRQVGDRAYVRAGFFSMMFGNETPWISMPAEDGADFATDFDSGPTDPHEVLGSYEGAAATVEDLGVESVNGTTATHYRIAVDAVKLADELSPDERAELEESGLLAIGVQPIDVWITDGGYLVRMILEIDGSEVASADGEFDAMKLTFDMYDINGRVVIEEPPAGEVTAIEDLDFGEFGFGDFDFEFIAEEL